MRTLARCGLLPGLLLLGGLGLALRRSGPPPPAIGDVRAQVNTLEAPRPETALFDPIAALALIAASNGTANERHTATTRLLQQWAAYAPHEALAWSRQRAARQAGTGETDFVEVVLRELSHRDQDITSLVADELAHPWSPDALHPVELALATIQLLLTSEDARAAATTIEHWTRAGLSERIGAAALEAIGAQIAERSPADALAWLRGLPAATGRDQALSTLLGLWDTQTPGAALAWVEALPAEAELRQKLLPHVVSAWAQRDPVAAAEWASIRATTGTDDALWASIATRSPLAGTDPTAALRLAALIAEPELRSTSLAEILRSWHAREPAAALEYLTCSPWPPSEKTLLTQRVYGHP